MNLLATLDQDYITALKNRETDKVNVLRLLKSALKNEAIQLGHEPNQSESQVVLAREAKQRKESIDLYASAGRDESARAESFELTVIESYLPQAMDQAALQSVVEAAIQETGATQKSDMGKVMVIVKKKLANPADVSVAAQLIAQALS